MAFQESTLREQKRDELDRIAKEEFGLDPSDYRSRNDIINAILKKQLDKMAEVVKQETTQKISQEVDPLKARVDKMEKAKEDAQKEQAIRAKIGAPPKKGLPANPATTERNLLFLINGGPKYWPVAEKLITKWGDMRKIDKAKYNKLLAEAKARHKQKTGHRIHRPKRRVISSKGHQIIYMPQK